MSLLINDNNDREGDKHMEMNRKYWKGLDELKETNEFLEQRDREFLNPCL
jgi:hypothetical protein